MSMVIASGAGAALALLLPLQGRAIDLQGIYRESDSGPAKNA